MLRREKGKMAGVFIHIFTFPQFVEKQVEKQKNAVNVNFFRVLKKFLIFNIFRSAALAAELFLW